MAKTTFNQNAAFSLSTRHKLDEHLVSVTQARALWTTFYGRLPQLRRGRPILDQAGRVVAESLGKDHIVLWIIQDSTPSEMLGLVAKITIQENSLRAWVANSRDVVVQQFEQIELLDDKHLMQKSVTMYHLTNEHDAGVGVGTAQFRGCTESMIVKFGLHELTRATSQDDGDLNDFVNGLDSSWAFDRKTLLSQHYIFVDKLVVNDYWVMTEMMSYDYQALMHLTTSLPSLNLNKLNKQQFNDDDLLSKMTLAFHRKPDTKRQALEMALNFHWDALKFLKQQPCMAMRSLTLCSVPTHPQVSPISITCYSAKSPDNVPTLTEIIDDCPDLKSELVSSFSSIKQNRALPGIPNGSVFQEIQSYLTEADYRRFKMAVLIDAVFFFSSSETAWEGFSRYLAISGIPTPVGLLKSTHRLLTETCPMEPTSPPPETDAA